jgi:hypothetical protein
MAWCADKYLNNVFDKLEQGQERVSKKEIELLIKRYCGVSKDETVNGIIRRWVDFGYLIPTDNVYIFKINYEVGK